jgi:hypothetical protein
LVAQYRIVSEPAPYQSDVGQRGDHTSNTHMFCPALFHHRRTRPQAPASNSAYAHQISKLVAIARAASCRFQHLAFGAAQVPNQGSSWMRLWVMKTEASDVAGARGRSYLQAGSRITGELQFPGTVELPGTSRDA